MDFRAACYCYSQLLQLVCYASRALIIFRFSRNFLGATVTCMSSLSSILLIQNRTNSLIQNRTNDFCASFAYLRAKLCIRPRKALHLPTQSIAIANAKHCICQRKALNAPTQSIACLYQSINTKHTNGGNTRKGYWRIANSGILHRAITNEHLCRAGYATLIGSYLEWHPK